MKLRITLLALLLGAAGFAVSTRTAQSESVVLANDPPPPPDCNPIVCGGV